MVQETVRTFLVEAASSAFQAMMDRLFHVTIDPLYQEKATRIPRATTTTIRKVLESVARVMLVEKSAIRMKTTIRARWKMRSLLFQAVALVFLAKVALTFLATTMNPVFRAMPNPLHQETTTRILRDTDKTTCKVLGMLVKHRDTRRRTTRNL
jgi:uncharacterized protein YyaL (SSP411 family)